MSRIDSDATIFADNETLTRNAVSFEKNQISLPTINPVGAITTERQYAVKNKLINKRLQLFNKNSKDS